MSCHLIQSNCVLYFSFCFYIANSNDKAKFQMSSSSCYFRVFTSLSEGLDCKPFAASPLMCLTWAMSFTEVHNENLVFWAGHYSVM